MAWRAFVRLEEKALTSKKDQMDEEFRSMAFRTYLEEYFSKCLCFLSVEWGQ